MKKWLSIVLTALLCVALVGCAEQQKPADTTSTTSAPTAAASTAIKPVAPQHTTRPMRRFIKEEEALALAAAYYAIEPGSVAPENGYVMSYVVIHPATPDEPYYTIRLQWLVTVDGNPSHQSEIDRIHIDAFTGEITSAYEEN